MAVERFIVFGLTCYGLGWCSAAWVALKRKAILTAEMRGELWADRGQPRNLSAATQPLGGKRR